MNWNECKRALAHAFAVNDGREQVEEADVDLLVRLSRIIVRKNLTTPAVLFLETMRPLNFVGSSVMTFFKPITGLLFTAADYERFARLLEKRCSIPLFIEQIEKAENALRPEKGRVQHA